MKMMRLGLLLLLCVAGCGDDDYNGSGSTEAFVAFDYSTPADLTGTSADGGVDLSTTD
jgi:hypothetical protein